MQQSPFIKPTPSPSPIDLGTQPERYNLLEVVTSLFIKNTIQKMFYIHKTFVITKKTQMKIKKQIKNLKIIIY